MDYEQYWISALIYRGHLGVASIQQLDPFSLIHSAALGGKIYEKNKITETMNWKYLFTEIKTFYKYIIR